MVWLRMALMLAQNFFRERAEFVIGNPALRQQTAVLERVACVPGAHKALGPVELFPTTLHLSIVYFALVGKLQGAVVDRLTKLWIH